jgi:hypothetical protein
MSKLVLIKFAVPKKEITVLSKALAVAQSPRAILRFFLHQLSRVQSFMPEKLHPSRSED